MGLHKKIINNIIEINKRKMKTKIILLSVAAILLMGIIFNCNNRLINTEKYITYTLEDIDSEVVLYRIDIKTEDSISNWAEIDYKIRIRYNDVSVKKNSEDSLINIILEELPVRPKEILISFNSND